MLKCLNYGISKEISNDLRQQMQLEVMAGQLVDRKWTEREKRLWVQSQPSRILLTETRDQTNLREDDLKIGT